jgi:hypothetical protein
MASLSLQQHDLPQLLLVPILAGQFDYCQVLCDTKYTRIGPVTDLGKVLILLGGMIVLVGLGLVLAGRTDFPLGRLPGDFVYRGRNTTFYFPLGTSIVISVVLSVLMYVVGRIRK